MIGRVPQKCMLKYEKYESVSRMLCMLFSNLFISYIQALMIISLILMIILLISPEICIHFDALMLASQS